MCGLLFFSEQQTTLINISRFTAFLHHESCFPYHNWPIVVYIRLIIILSCLSVMQSWEQVVKIITINNFNIVKYISQHSQNVHTAILQISRLIFQYCLVHINQFNFHYLTLNSAYESCKYIFKDFQIDVFTQLNAYKPIKLSLSYITLCRLSVLVKRELASDIFVVHVAC